MTTHEEPLPEFSSVATEPHEGDVVAAESEPRHTDAEPPPAEPPPAEPPPAEPSPAEPSNEGLLFADVSGLRARWDDVQAAFVDDPAECVHKADALVVEVVDQLTAGFSEARSRLESQWAQGGEASTEDLRIALTRYREFFQRLLAV